MTEKGYQVGQWGIIGWASIVEETHETNPDLMYPKSIDVFDRMRREDPQVKSVIRAVTLPVIRTEWALDGAGCREEVNEFISQSIGVQVKGKPNRAARRRKGRFSMKEHLRMALLCLVYGHSFFEQVYGVDAARRNTLDKLAWRPPRTISKINVARDGGLESIEQHGVDDPIPVDALVAYVNEREGGNWVGVDEEQAAVDAKRVYHLLWRFLSPIHVLHLLCSCTLQNQCGAGSGVAAHVCRSLWHRKHRTAWRNVRLTSRAACLCGCLG